MPVVLPQLIEQATRHASHLERLKSHEVAALRKLLAGIQAELLATVAQENITAWTRQRAERQLSVIGAMLSERYGNDIIPTLNASIDELAKYEAGFEARSLKAVAPSVEFAIPSATQVLSAVRTNPLTMTGIDGGMLLDAFLKDWTQDQVRNSVNVIRSGFAQGQTTAQIVKRISTETNQINDRALQTMTRTALQHVAVQAREQTWAVNSDIIKAVRIVATLDTKTSAQCRALDSQEFPIDKGPRPPFHPNCRTTVVPVLADKFKFLSEGAERAERDPETGKIGYVDAKESYYAWLKKQPAEVQDSIIGPTRGTLLRDGGLSAQRFAELQLGKNFIPLPLFAKDGKPSMYALEPVAFQRAGIKKP